MCYIFWKAGGSIISIMAFSCYIHKGSGLNFCLSTFLFLVWSNGKRRIEFLLRVNQDNLQCDSVCRDRQTRMMQSFLSYSCGVNNTSSRNQIQSIVGWQVEEHPAIICPFLLKFEVLSICPSVDGRRRTGEVLPVIASCTSALSQTADNGMPHHGT